MPSFRLLARFVIADEVRECENELKSVRQCRYVNVGTSIAITPKVFFDSKRRARRLKITQTLELGPFYQTMKNQAPS